MKTSTSLSSEYAHATKALGDARRSARMGSMLNRLSRHPCGRVSEVFSNPAEQQGAYDFLEHSTVRAEAVQEVCSTATARRCRGESVVYGIIDGSSLAFPDPANEKGFGSVGTHRKGGRGLKLLNVLALDERGQTIGILTQDYWCRPNTSVKRSYRPLKTRESYRWHVALDRACATLAAEAPGTRVHMLGDREADASELLRHMLEKDCDFTVRANGTRHAKVGGHFVPLMPQLKRQRPLATMTVEIPRKGGRPKRTAELEVRALRLEVRLRDSYARCLKSAPLTVVWARERRPPRGVERLDWLLFTTDALSPESAVQAVGRYTLRWRIEEFHKMLKSGGGCVEDSRLRSAQAVIKWATLHSIVASRAQRLRDLATTTPDAPATIDLTAEDIEALVLLKTQEKRKTETISSEGLTIARAVRWIGDLGGFAATGVSTKMPGPTVIGRGLERVQDAADVIRALRAAGKIR